MASESTEDRLHATFVMEQHVGHKTFYQNLRKFVDQDTRLCPTWVPVTYQTASRQPFWYRLSPRSLRGTLEGRAQVRAGLHTHCDVLFFNTQVPAVLGGPIPQHTPYFISTDITPIQYDEMATLYQHHLDRLGLLKWLKHRANVKTLCQAARILPWTAWVRDSLVRDYHVPQEHITVMPSGVDTEFWTLKPGFARNGRFKILFVGGDFYRKGGAILLQAFRALPDGLVELHIVTRSDVPAAEGIHIYRDMQPNTVELLSLYHQCDAFVLPTGADAFGLVLVEAMACGLPVVTTRVGGVAEVVADGETGYLVQPGDGEALRAHILQLTEDDQLLRRMGIAANKRVNTFFNARTQAASVVTLLCQVAAEHQTKQGRAQ